MGISGLTLFKEILETHRVITEKPLKNNAKNISEFEKTNLKRICLI